MRLFGLHRESLFQIGFGFGPLLEALMADAAEIIDDPVLLGVGFAVGFAFAIFARRNIKRLRIGVGAFGKLLARALNIAERHDRIEILAVIADNILEQFDGIISAINALQRGRFLNLCVALERRSGGHALIHFQRQLRTLDRLIQIGERQQREAVLRLEIQCQLQIDQSEVFSAAPRQ